MSSPVLPERVGDSEEAEDRSRRRGHPPVDPILSKLTLIPSPNSQPLPHDSHLNAHNSRPMSPTILSLRFGSRNDARTSRWSTELGATKTRRASVQSTLTDRGKERASVREREDHARPMQTGSGLVDRDSLASPSTGASSYRTSSRPSTAPGSPVISKKGVRGSIFMAASDALGFKFGRRRPPVRQATAPVVFPDVIEITARKRDEEEEERCRLRAEAAQAIGLDPNLVNPETQSRHNTTDEDEDEDGQGQNESGNVHDLTSSQHHGDNMRNNSTYLPHTSAQVQGSTTSVPSTTPPLHMTIGRYRSGSLMGHSRTNSANLTPVPPYPSTVSSLTQWQQYSGTLPKYYQSSSLRMFALSSSKNWKTRYIMLTSPTAIISRTMAPAVSYLHLFKGPGPDEKELERLEINEDSVVFVSDDEVGGRRRVVKVGGIEVGAFKKELNYQESGRTLWFLQMEDPAESQQWISAIKNSILNQRAIRAGLLPAAVTSFGVNEPRGDIDVMLSMRAQGFFTSSPPPGRQHFSTPPSTVAQAEKNYASSISEHSIQSHASTPKASTTVSTLKSLFTGSRPRSTSRAASTDTTKPLQHDPNEDNFGGMGNNLMSMLRVTTPDVQSQSSGATIVRANSPFLPSATPEIGIDRRIVPDRHPLQFVTNDLPTTSTASRGTKAVSLGSMSLQPPPRKRGVPSLVTPTATLTSIRPAPEVYQNAQYNGTTGSLGALTYYKDHQEPASPSHTATSMTGTSDNHRRPSSMQSVSTYASNENSLSVDRSSTTSTKRTSSSAKRWSKRVSLPPRTSPPTGPPPSVPGSGSHPQFPGDASSSRSRSRPSSAVSAHSQQSIISSLPSFSKRASVSSVGTSSSNSHSTTGQAIGRPGIGSHRSSMPPPPRPAPTSALPPAPGDRDRALSVDSLPTARTSPKTKRASMPGRGFKLSMIAPSKPPPSNNLPPRPDEVEYKRTSGSRLSSLDPIPASPDPSVAPFPPPRGPLPPTPAAAEGAANNNNRQSTGVSRHTSLRERLRILSAPSSPPSITGGATSAGVDHAPTSAPSNTNIDIDPDDTTNMHTHANTRPNPPFTSRFSGSGFHHGRTPSTSSSNGNSSAAGVSFLSLTSNTNKQQNNRKSIPPPLASTPSYLNMTNTHSQPATPIGEKIMSFETESSFLNFTPISPSDPLPSSSPHTSMPTSMNMPTHLRPLPTVPVAVTTEITSLSPPPRRNSKQLNFERPPSPSRTPSTPSIFDDKPTESKLEPKTESPRQPIVPIDAFGSSVSPTPLSLPGQLPPLLSLPPSPLSQPTSEERSATPLDSPSDETHRTTPSPPASIISLGMGL